jgi:hypothetical protein
MLHGKILNSHSLRAQITCIRRVRASTSATSTVRNTYFVKSKCQRHEHKAHKKHVVLSFFLLQSYAYAYKIEYLISKVTHFIQMEASENLSITCLVQLFFLNHSIHCNLSEDIQRLCLTVTNVGM